jgi:plastocyanin
MKPSIAARILVVGSTVLLAAGCGGSSSSNSLPPGYYISISGMAFSPLNLDVPPGATVTVINHDSMGHSVTSEATPNAYVPGGVAGVSFDTTIFTGTKTFTVGAAAPEGTLIPYFCLSHTGLMATPNGSITVHASATQGTPPGGVGGGYGY